MIFCRHDWEIMSENTDYLGRKFIFIVKCKKCGKFKKFVEEI